MLKTGIERLRVALIIEDWKTLLISVVQKERWRFRRFAVFERAKRTIVHANRTGRFALVEIIFSTDIAFRHRSKI